MAEEIKDLRNKTVTFKGFSSKAEKQNFKVYDFECVKQDLINRLSVRKGERVENPEFGTIIYDCLFEPFTDSLKDQIMELLIRLAKIFMSSNLVLGLPITAFK